MNQQTVQNSWSGEKMDFFQWKQLLNTKLLLKYLIYIFDILLLPQVVVLGAGNANLLASAKPENPVCHCLKIPDGSIKIDGYLAEPVWNQAEKIYFRGLADGSVPPKPSFARLLWDSQYLYAGYNISDENVVAFYGDRKRGANYRGRPRHELWTGESEIMFRDTFVKLFVDPDADGLNYVEIHINPINNVADLILKYPNNEKECNKMGIFFNDNKKFILAERYDWFWNCGGLQSAVQIQGTLNYSKDKDQGWTVEIAIPWTALKPFSKGDCPPKPGQKWRLHAGAVYKPEFAPERRRRSKHIYWTWPVLGVINCHLPSRWGFLIFDEMKSNNKLNWKMTWCWTLPCGNKQDIEYGVRQAKNLGFNAMEWSQAQAKFPKIFVEVCRKHNIESYYCINPVSKVKQQLLKTEYDFPVSSQAGGEPLDKDIGKVIAHKKGRRFCFNQADAVENAQRAIDKAISLGFNGIALDFVGYDNLHGCYCHSCNRARKDYFNAHPGMSKQDAENRFSEECLVRFYDLVIAYGKSVKPEIKTTCHIYPAFMPHILYGNLLPVDYCGQTVAWFFKPHWKFEKIKKYSEIVVRDENKYHAHSIGAPFIAFYCRGKYVKDRKTAERMKLEIRITKEAGAKGIQIAELGNILVDRAVSRSLAEELGGNPEAIKLINVPKMRK